MSKLAFLFPGQGSQQTGMGKALADRFTAARAVFEEADEALGFGLSRLCFEGPDEELKKTENTQPAILAVSIAAWRVAREHGLEAGMVAGHSLGEYSALVAAGSLTLPDAVQIVRKRGRYMQDAVPEGVGAMAALLKMPEGKLAEILEAAAQGEVVAAANLNSPDQIVIAGHSGAVERAMALAKEAGAKRAVLLPVSAPFHCPLMKPAQERLKADLDQTPFADLAMPLVNNWRAEAVTTGAEARQGLYEQVPNPVQWTRSVLKLVELGCDRFIELGPGAVLNGLCRQIAPALKGSKLGEPADVEKLAHATA